MWHIYISIAVLFRGAYCNPVINTAEPSNCTVVIKRFGEQVKTLEVKWHSTIHLICDASCVGPGPQPGLTWFYKDKNQSKLINIEKLFRSPKFETYPINFHRKNELVIRDFGPNEETDFICKGAIKKQRQEATVALNGTDCLLKYNFRCKSGNKCIDLAYLCNQHNECPDGEDEVGCGNDMNTITIVATIRIPEKDAVTEETSDESNYIDMTTMVSTMLMPETDVETKPTSKETKCRGDQFQCSDGNCVEARMKCDGTPQCEDGSDELNCPSCPPNNFQCETTSQLECVDASLVCDRFPDCTDGSDEVGCPSCRIDQFTCTDGNCVEGNMRCDGIAQCEDRSDEIGCPTVVCLSDEFRCVNEQKCVSIAFRCNGIWDCEDGSDEADCVVTEAPSVVCTADQYKCANGECVDGKYRCDGQHNCYDGSDEENCPTDVCLSDEFRCVNQRKCVSIAFRCNGIWDCEDGSDEADCAKSCEFQCKNGTCISSTKKCDGIPDCPDGEDEICEIPLICPEGKKGCKDLSKCIDDSQFCNGVRDCTDGGDEKDCGQEKEKIIVAIAGINDDGDNGPLSTTDSVTDNTEEFIDTTPFDYELYAN